MRLLVSGKRSSLKRIKTHLDVIGLRELGVVGGCSLFKNVRDYSFGNRSDNGKVIRDLSHIFDFRRFCVVVSAVA